MRNRYFLFILITGLGLALGTKLRADWESDFSCDDLTGYTDSYSVGDMGYDEGMEALDDGMLLSGSRVYVLPPVHVYANRVNVNLTVSFTDVNMMFIFSGATQAPGEVASGQELSNAETIACQLSVDATYDTYQQKYLANLAAYKAKIDDLVNTMNEGMAAQHAAINAWTEANLPSMHGLVDILVQWVQTHDQDVISDGPGNALKAAADAKYTADILLLSDWKADAYSYCATDGRFATPIGG